MMLIDFAVAPVGAGLVGSLLIKTTLVLAVAGLLTACLPRASAAARHAVWAIAFVMLLALPGLSLVLPSWAPAWDVFAPRVATVPVPAELTVPLAAPGPGPAGAVAIGAEPVSPPWWRSRSLLASIFTIVWGLGASAILTRLGMHAWHARAITRRGRTSRSAHLSRLATDIAARLGVRRPVHVVLSSEIRMPSSWGFTRGVILLPATATNWSDEARRTVLAHELAHVARGDYLIHLVIEAVCALYWINPLVWLAARRAAVERERACDDAAIRLGTPGPQYARHLVAVARIGAGFPDPTGVLSMARGQGLMERVRSVTTTGVDRSPAGWRRVVLTGGLLAAVGLSVAALDIQGVQDRLATVEELIADLRHDDSKVRLRAAWALGEREDPQAIPALIEQLRHGPHEVRVVAAWALGEIKNPLAIDDLAASVDDDDPLVREMAVLALGETESPGAIPHLLNAFDRHRDLRAAVAWAMGEIDGDEADRARALVAVAGTTAGREVWAGEQDTPVRRLSHDVDGLIDRLANGDVRDRRIAAYNLGVLGDPIAVDPLLTALRDREASVRAMAVWALDEINPSQREE